VGVDDSNGGEMISMGRCGPAANRDHMTELAIEPGSSCREVSNMLEEKLSIVTMITGIHVY
jgi:hypothetical protein